MSNQFCKNYSAINIKSQPKIIYNQEIISLKNLLKSEVREIKGKEYIDAYIRLLEKKYEKILEDSINNKNEDIKSLKHNQLFQKIFDKNNNKLIIRNQSQNDLYNMNKSITNSKLLNLSKSFSNNYSSIRKDDKINNKYLKKSKSKKSNNNSNSYYKSTYWEDYDFLKIKKINKKSKTNKIKQIIKKDSLEEQIFNKINNNNKSIYNNKKHNDDNDNKHLQNYYLYLLKRRKKNNNYLETNEEKKNEKNNIEIMRKILEQLFNDDELLINYLEDDNIPEFYKRFIIQDEIKKDNLFEKRFKLNYNEAQKMIGPKINNGSRLICENIINYIPIDKRLDTIIKKKKKDIEEIKKDLEERPQYNTSRTRKNSWKITQDWLKKMDNWNKNKMLKIQKKREEIEKNNLSCSECKFKPFINKNAHLKKEDENVLFSDRLYSEYFTLRQKKENMFKKQQEYFSFRPKLNKSSNINHQYIY